MEIITINIDKKLTRISLKKALEGAFPVSEPADLTGYLALSDGILNDIMHAVPVETNNKETQTETQTDDCSLMEQVIEVHLGLWQTDYAFSNNNTLHWNPDTLKSGHLVTIRTLCFVPMQ